jgi:hypothetical protein
LLGSPLNGSIHIIIPTKFILFNPPDPTIPPDLIFKDHNGRRRFRPEFYADLLYDLGVRLVLRLGAADYDPAPFTARGIRVCGAEHLTPTPCDPAAAAADNVNAGGEGREEALGDDALDLFFALAEAAGGAVAMHGGVGGRGLRAGCTLVAGWMMRHQYFASPDVAAAWIAIARGTAVSVDCGALERCLARRRLEEERKSAAAAAAANADAVPQEPARRRRSVEEGRRLSAEAPELRRGGRASADGGLVRTASASGAAHTLRHRWRAGGGGGGGGGSVGQSCPSLTGLPAAGRAMSSPAAPARSAAPQHGIDLELDVDGPPLPLPPPQETAGRPQNHDARPKPAGAATAPAGRQSAPLLTPLACALLLLLLLLVAAAAAALFALSLVGS